MNKDERRQWHLAVFGADLTPGERLVLLALETFTDYPAGTNAYPGIEKLAEMCGFGQTVVKNALAKGQRLRLIEQTAPAIPKGGKADVYRLLPQPISGDTSASPESSRDTMVSPQRDLKGHESSFKGHEMAVQETPSSRSRDTIVSPTSPLPVPTPVPVHQEKPSSLRSEGKEIPRSQAHAPTTTDDLELRANALLDEHVYSKLNRKGVARTKNVASILRALQEGRSEDQVIAVIKAWRGLLRADWSQLETMLKHGASLDGRSIDGLAGWQRSPARRPK